jgi:hypothetical protein
MLKTRDLPQFESLMKINKKIGDLYGRRPYLFIDGSSGAAKKTDSSKSATLKSASEGIILSNLSDFLSLARVPG